MYFIKNIEPIKYAIESNMSAVYLNEIFGSNNSKTIINIKTDKMIWLIGSIKLLFLVLHFRCINRIIDKIIGKHNKSSK